MKIGIIGAGIGGLILGYYLSQKGYEITIWEENKEAGGLLRGIPIGNSFIEGYYHHLFTKDHEAINLIKKLGLGEKILFLNGKIGIYYGNKIYPFTGALDLLRFSPLPFVDRWRCGLFTLYLKLLKNGQYLKEITAVGWLKKYMGEKVYKVIWQPLLEGKFGEEAPKISMIWLWNRIYRRGEKLVYLHDGFQQLITRLKEKIEGENGTILIDTKINNIKELPKNKIEVSYNNILHIFDKVIVTTSIPEFIRNTKDLPEKYTRTLREIKYRSGLCVLLFLKKKFLENVYWLNIHDQKMQILSVVEQTNFMKPQDYGNKHVLYVGNYPDSIDNILKMSDQELVRVITKELKKINKDFEEKSIESYYVFRDKEAQPVVTTNYAVPDFHTPIKNLYLMTMAQIYPEDRGINQAVKMAKQLALIIKNEK